MGRRRNSITNQGELKEFHVISLGMGTQSSAMLIDALEGKFDFRPDVAIFSDLHTEPKQVYDFAKDLESYCLENYDFQITTISQGNYLQDIRDFISGKKSRVATPPLFVDNSGKVGKIMRQCTNDYKIATIRKEAKKRMRAAGMKKMVMHMGITMDEHDRAADICFDKSGKRKSPQYITDSFPYIQQIITYREQCVKMLEDRGLSPFKSSCTFCPYHSNSYWNDMKQNRAEEFEECCKVDDLIRDFPGMDNACYLHKSLIPLREIEFHKLDVSLFHAPAGYCHSGLCGV